ESLIRLSFFVNRHYRRLPNIKGLHGVCKLSRTDNFCLICHLRANCIRAISVEIQWRLVRMFAIGANVLPQIWKDAAMSRANKTSKQKRRGKTLPALGTAGLSLALTSGAHAATAGTSVDKPTLNTLLSQEITLTEEEISDVSLSTFYVFDKENTH